MGVRFLHSADGHLGSRPPELESKMLDLMVNMAREKECDFILCVGDVFDKPSPGQQTKDMLIEKILKNPEVEFIFTVGNHDLQTKDHSQDGYHSLITLKLLQNIANVLVIQPGFVAGFQWGDILSLPNPIESFESPPRRPGLRVVCFHGVVQGANPHLQSEYTASQLVAKYDADYLALGDQHIHRAMAPNAWYPGCPVQKTYGCEEGLVLVELSGAGCKTESLHLPLPKKITVDVSKFEIGKDSEQSIIKDVLEKFPKPDNIKLKFHLPQTVWSKVDHQRIGKELGEFYPEVRLENDPGWGDTRMRESTSIVTACKSIKEEISKVIELESLNLDKERLLQVCLEFTK